MKKLTLTSFIQRCSEKYSNTQDYKNVILKTGTDKVWIRCKIHDTRYHQTPYNHLQNNGCPKCRGEAISKEKTTTNKEIFVRRATEIHGDKYDYSLVDYVNTAIKVSIMCPRHGVFLQPPIVHINQKCGCPKCGFEKTSFKQSSDKDQFTKKALEIHGDKYDYSKFVYLNSRTKGIIVCKKHGDFFQQPYSHLTGSGCSKCHFEKMSLDRKSNSEEFQKKARGVYGDRYGYDKAVYLGYHDPIEIYCKVHKKYFWKKVVDHLGGSGCPYCSESKGERLVSKFLDENNIKYVRQYTVGDNNRFRYDFYLPDHNVLIEYNGVQHYHYTDYFHKDNEGFMNQLVRDTYKREIAKAWKIKLITLKYTLDTQDKVNSFLQVKLNIKK